MAPACCSAGCASCASSWPSPAAITVAWKTWSLRVLHKGHFQHLEITLQHKPVHTHIHSHSQSRGLSQMCFPHVLLTPVPLLHRAEEGSASTGMSSSTRGSHSCSLLRDPGASQECLRGDTVLPQLLEHLPPSCCCPRALQLLGESPGLLSTNRVFISSLRKIHPFPKF